MNYNHKRKKLFITFRYKDGLSEISNNIINSIINFRFLSEKLYYNSDQLIFDGTNYIDTGVKLFSDENISKNFEISFELTNVEDNQSSQATILNSMVESSPYPGFVVRVQTNNTQIEFNSPKIASRSNMSINSTNKIKITRVNDIYYLQVNDGTIQNLGTYSGTNFDDTVNLGASIDGNGNPWRYFKGTLSNVNITITEPETYTIKFDSNGGTGMMDDQIIRKDETKALAANSFEKEAKMFDYWNTNADGTGINYKNNQSVKNLTTTENDIVDLYAIWANTEYKYNGEYVFDGTNYIDTRIYLFSEETYEKDFDISFEIVERVSSGSQTTMMSAMDESGSPWPGIVYRVQSTSQDNICANASSSVNLDRKYNNNINIVILKRRSGILYISFNDETEEQLINMTSFSKTFDVPLTFGCSLNASGNSQRYFKGTLKNMNVKLYT